MGRQISQDQEPTEVQRAVLLWERQARQPVSEWWLREHLRHLHTGTGSGNPHLYALALEVATARSRARWLESRIIAAIKGWRIGEHDDPREFGQLGYELASSYHKTGSLAAAIDELRGREIVEEAYP